jgi:hypothetical protein
MDFFDKKEDVLDFQLTEYGKSLLEKGPLQARHIMHFLMMTSYMTLKPPDLMKNKIVPRIESNMKHHL